VPFLVITFAEVKIVCLILSLYVIVLSVKPCCADDNCRVRSASQKQLSKNAASKEKECPGCSPFFTCGSCVGFVVSKPVTLGLPLAVETGVKYFADYRQPFIKKITFSIWLPPKIS